MNAYVLTADRLRVIEGVGGVDVGPDGMAAIRGADAAAQPLATVPVAGGTWVVLGTHVPPGWERLVTVEIDGDGGWPPEPPPDVDSEG